MCIGGRSQPIQQAPTYRDAPPIVTGSQTGVENPKDTRKATEDLKIKRQKREGTYVDPNLSRLEDSLTRRSGNKSTFKKDSTGRIRKMSVSSYRKSLRSRARSKSSKK